MEYLKVIVPGRDGQDIDVLLNKKERIGKVGEALALGEGYVLVTVDLPNAEEKVVELWDTTRANPKVIEILE